MRVEFTPSPTLFPFTSRWTELDWIRIHYVDEGSGTQEDAPDEIVAAVRRKFGATQAHAGRPAAGANLGEPTITS